MGWTLASITDGTRFRRASTRASICGQQTHPPSAFCSIELSVPLLPDPRDDFFPGRHLFHAAVLRAGARSIQRDLGVEGPPTPPLWTLPDLGRSELRSPIGDLHRGAAAGGEAPRVACDNHRRCPPAGLHDRRQFGTVAD